MAVEQRCYIVRDAGTPSRPGKIFKTYPYTLAALLESMDDARLRSYNEGPQEVMRVIGRERIVFRRYEKGQEVPVKGHGGGSGRR